MLNMLQEPANRRLSSNVAIAFTGDDVQPEIQTAELSVIVPTFNESQNVAEIVQRLEACLDGLSWEVIFVDDDSTDGTAIGT